MDCTICGKPSLPGAMLCAPCKAALKRARYVTVQEDMRRSSVIDVRRQPRHARSPSRPATGPRLAPCRSERAGSPPPTARSPASGSECQAGADASSSASSSLPPPGRRKLFRPARIGRPCRRCGVRACGDRLGAASATRRGRDGTAKGGGRDADFSRRCERAAPRSGAAAPAATQPAPAAAVPPKRTKPSPRAAVATAYEPFEGPNVAREPEKIERHPRLRRRRPRFPIAGRTCATRRRNVTGRACSAA